MTVQILGLGTALPGEKITTEAFLDHAKQLCCSTSKQEKVLTELYRRTEIQTRSSVLASNKYGHRGEQVLTARIGNEDRGPGTRRRMECYQSEVTPLAVRASEAALADSMLNANQITHIVTASCTGFAAPGFDIDIIDQLHLPRTTQRTHVGFMGCHGAMNALRVATGYCRADKNATVLLCAAELCSLHFQYGWQTDNLIANSLFADGAAALVIREQATPRSAGWTVLDSKSIVLTNCADAMEWKIGDNGFQMKLDTSVPELVEKELAAFVVPWLVANGLQVDQVASWAVHPGGPRILDAVERALSLSSGTLDLCREILASCGNMSSPTVLFILEQHRLQKQSGPCVVLGFGPGLTIEAALLTLH